MPILRIKDPDFWSLLGESASRTGAGALEGWMQGQQQLRQEQKRQRLQQTLSSEYNIPNQALQDLDVKSLESLVTKQAMEAPKLATKAEQASLKQQEELLKKQEELSGVQRSLDKINRAKDLYSQTSLTDPLEKFLGGGNKKIELKNLMQSISKDPYIKKTGFEVPTPEAGASFPSMMNDLEGLMRDQYKIQEPQRQQEAPPEQAQQLPQELVQPRGLQQAQPGYTPPQDVLALEQAAKERGVGGELSRAPRILGQVATEYAGARYAPPVISNIIKGVEDFRESALPSEEMIDEVAKGMPEAQAKQLRDLYASEKKARSFKISDYLPTTSNIKKLVELAVGKGALDPQSKIEKNISDITRRTAALGLFSGSGPGAALAGAFLGKTGKKVAKAAGLGKIGQAIADTTLTMFADPLVGAVRDKVYKNTKKIYGAVDEGNLGKYGNSSGVAKNAQKVLMKSAKAPDEINTALTKQLIPLEVEAASGRMSLTGMREQIKRMNRYWYNEGRALFDKTARGEWNQVRGSLEDAFEKGMKGNKLGGLFKQYEKAQQMTAGLKSSEFAISKFKEGLQKGKFKGTLWRSLFQLSPAAAIGGGLGTAVGGFAGAKIGAGAGLALTELNNAYKFLNTPEVLPTLMTAFRQAAGNTIPVVAMEKLDAKYAKKERRSQRKK